MSPTRRHPIRHRAGGGANANTPDATALARALSTTGLWKAWVLPEPAAARPVLEPRLLLDDYEAAEAAFVEARAVGAFIDNPRLGAQADHHLGQLGGRRGNLGEAEDLHHAALAARAGRGLLPGVTTW